MKRIFTHGMFSPENITYDTNRAFTPLLVVYSAFIVMNKAVASARTSPQGLRMTAVMKSFRPFDSLNFAVTITAVLAITGFLNFASRLAVAISERMIE
jgi:hypothetical protein